MKKTNYFDEHGNYINVENLSLSEIYKRGAEEGYKKGYIDASISKETTECSVGISEMADGLFDKLMNGGV